MKIYIVILTDGQEYSEGYMESAEIWRAFIEKADAIRYVRNPDEEGRKRIERGYNTAFEFEEIELL